MLESAEEKRVIGRGRVDVKAVLSNLEDTWSARRGSISPEEVRSIELAEAVVDPDDTLLGLPQSCIHELGLAHVQTRRHRTEGGSREINVHQPVVLTIGDRNCTVEVFAVPDESPMLIGQRRCN